MHICLFVRPRNLDELNRLTAVVETRAVTAAVAVPASLLEEADPESITTLANADIEWVRSARTAPSLTLLPDRFVQSAIAVEYDSFQSLGLSGAALYFEGPPGVRLPRIANEADVSSLITRTPEPRSGVLVNLDMITPCFGAADTVDLVGSSDTMEVWYTSLDQLEERLSLISSRAGCDLTTPTRYLESHQVTGTFSTDDLGADPDELLARKVIRLATRLPKRPSADVVNLILEGAAVESIASNAGLAAHRRAHSALIEARAHIDASRRRADDWARVSRLDWDADGSEEVQVELKTTSFVIDPSAGGELLVFDDKVTGQPISWLDDEPPGQLAHRQIGSEAVAPIALSVEGLEERRDGVVLRMSDVDGNLGLTVTVSDRALELEFSVSQVSDARVGPELPLLLGDTRLRVDGGTWITVDEPHAVSGHRFRLIGETRGVLVTSMLPTDLFIRPSHGGVVIWPNWVAAAIGRFSVRIDLNQPTD